MKLDIFAEDKSKQEKGSPCYIGDDDSCFYVKRIGTPDARKEMQELSKRLFGFAEKVDDSLLMGNWLALHGVTGWEGIDGDDGELKFTQHAAVNIFTNPKYMLSLNQILLTHATNYANYLHDEMCEDAEEVKKN